tara:strand:- start:252 stop:950 length:699 start_codon:yes stop_codon:yes gene_type:complete
MDSFDFKKYLKEGRLHKFGEEADQEQITESQVSEKKYKQGYNDRDDEAIGAKDGAEKGKKVSMKGRRDMSRGMEKALGNRPDSTDSKMDEQESTSKMKVSELKAKIREEILSTLNEEEWQQEVGSQYHSSLYNEQEDVDVDVDVDDEVEVDADVDVEDEVSVDAEGDDIEITKKAVKAKVEVGLSPEEEIVQDSLKAAMDASIALGNDKLADQIGNTITFFTREYVVGQNTD